MIANRARHILEENQRTVDAAEALRVGDVQRLSRLMAESHRSMKDLFEITVPEIDFLVELIAGELGEEGGVRMTGGGFGGCVVALAPHHKVQSITSVVKEHYEARFGHGAEIYRCQPVAGAALFNI